MLKKLIEKYQQMIKDKYEVVSIRQVINDLMKLKKN